MNQDLETSGNLRAPRQRIVLILVSCLGLTLAVLLAITESVTESVADEASDASGIEIVLIGATLRSLSAVLEPPFHQQF